MPFSTKSCTCPRIILIITEYPSIIISLWIVIKEFITECQSMNVVDTTMIYE